MKEKTAMLQLLSQWRGAGTTILAACWLIGVLLGFCAALSASKPLVDVILRAGSACGSFFWLLLLLLLPLVISALADLTGQRWLMIAICFVKAFCFSFCAVGVSLAYGSAGWLVRLLLLFSDYFTIPMLYIFSYFALKGSFDFQQHLLTAAFAYYLAAGAIDYFVVMPYLRLLLG